MDNSFSVSKGNAGADGKPVIVIGEPATMYTECQALELAAALIETVQPAPLEWSAVLARCAPDWWGTIGGPAEETTTPPVVGVLPAESIPAAAPAEWGAPAGEKPTPASGPVPNPTPDAGPAPDPGGLGVPIGTKPGQKPTPASGPVPDPGPSGKPPGDPT